MKLYHYTTGLGLKGILESNEFHCNNISFLNDPSETFYFKSLIDKVLKNDEICKEVHTKLYNKALEDHYSMSTKFILSFCKNGDSLSMWNRYSKDEGYCLGIELDIENLNYNNSEKGYFIENLEIEYDKNRQLELISNLILKYLPKLNEIDEYNFDYESPSLYSLSLDYTADLLSFEHKFKHSAYKEEEEIRLVITVKDYCQEKNIIGYKVSNDGIFIEYFRLQILFEKILKEIICSPTSNQLKLQGLKSYIYNKYGFEKINITKSEIPYR